MNRDNKELTELVKKKEREETPRQNPEEPPKKKILEGIVKRKPEDGVFKRKRPLEKNMDPTVKKRVSIDEHVDIRGL